MPLPDSVLFAYGVLAGGVRLAIPAILDLPFVHTVRGAMFDRLAREAGVTLTADARRTLVDLEQPRTSQGLAEQLLRLAATRLIPAGRLLDAGRNTLRTYAAGAVFQRYLVEHRRRPEDPVIDGREAERVLRALRGSLAVVAPEHVKALVDLALGVQAHADASSELSVVQRYGDAIVSSVADVPTAWLDVIDARFRENLGT